MPEFFTIIARKIFFQNLGGHYAYAFNSFLQMQQTESECICAVDSLMFIAASELRGQQSESLPQSLCCVSL